MLQFVLECPSDLTGHSELKHHPAIQHARQGQSRSADGLLSGNIKQYLDLARLTYGIP